MQTIEQRRNGAKRSKIVAARLATGQCNRDDKPDKLVIKVSRSIPRGPRWNELITSKLRDRLYVTAPRRADFLVKVKGIGFAGLIYQFVVSLAGSFAVEGIKFVALSGSAVVFEFFFHIAPISISILFVQA